MSRKKIVYSCDLLSGIAETHRDEGDDVKEFDPEPFRRIFSLTLRDALTPQQLIAATLAENR